jgi:hypothetical protein
MMIIKQRIAPVESGMLLALDGKMCVTIQCLVEMSLDTM